MGFLTWLSGQPPDSRTNGERIAQNMAAEANAHFTTVSTRNLSNRLASLQQAHLTGSLSLDELHEMGAIEREQQRRK